MTAFSDFFALLSGVSYDEQQAAIKKELRTGFAGLPLLAKRTAMGTAPTITSGATSSMVANSRSYPVGYASTLSAMTISGGAPDTENTTGQSFGFVNITTNFDLDSFTGSTKRVSFIFTGQLFELEFQPSTTSVFWLKIDGEFESLTAVSETNAFRKYDLGASGTYRVEIIAGGTDVQSFFLKGIWVGPTDGIVKAPVRGPRTILMGDSFGTAPSAFPYWFGEALGWEDVWGSGVGSTGYLATGGDTAPTFRMRVDHDVIGYSPQVVGIVGSVNDNGSSYQAIYDEALTLYRHLVRSLPNALIFAAHTVSSGPSQEVPESLRNRAAKKAAAEAAGILWVDPTEQVVAGRANAGTMQFNASAGASAVVVSDTWASLYAAGYLGASIQFGDPAAGTGHRYYIKSRQQSGAYTQLNLDGTLSSALSAGDPYQIVGSSYMVGDPDGTYGNAPDLVIGTGDLHPTAAGQEALGYALANSLVNAILNS